MFVWIISYVALRCAALRCAATRTQRFFVCANNWSRRKLHGDGDGDDDVDDSASELRASDRRACSFLPAP